MRNVSSHRVTTYNVLSSHLAEPSHFQACNPTFLDASYRYTSLLKRLNKEVDAEATICLQEVSMQWAGELHTYFSNRNYHFITALYGKKFNGYMGVAIAVPMSKYEIGNVTIERLADTISLPRQAKPSLIQSLINSIYRFVASLLRWKEPEDTWKAATDRFNQIIAVALHDKQTQQSFVIANYHMPCMFQLPSVMLIHCTLAAQFVHRLAAGSPYVLAGDFNITPLSSCYALLTQGSLPPTHEHQPPQLDGWTSAVSPMRSAYALANGSEPNFTNYAKVKNDPPFIDTLDYIFLSPQWTVIDTEALPHRDEVKGPLPNEEEGSDHILLAARLTLDAE